MHHFQKRILVTGGAGFIGSHLLNTLVPKYGHYFFVNADKLGWGSCPDNLKAIAPCENYVFHHIDIVCKEAVLALLKQYQITHILHLAAESHVDRSIQSPLAFIENNIMGTGALLEAARLYWQGSYEGKLWHHISTDEVYGSLSDLSAYFTEQSAYAPRSPYAASKAGADHLTRAYFHTYALPTCVSNCSNNYGPYQFSEKLIPLTLLRILKSEPIPVYGRGDNIRDWLWVGDHIRAIDIILHKGQPGATYNIGAHNEYKNIDLVRLIVAIMAEKLQKPYTELASLITFTQDRLGHDFRYAIAADEIRRELGWTAEMPFEKGLRQTIDWYLAHTDFLFYNAEKNP